MDAADDPAMFECCMCTKEVVEPMLLGCMHSCCRRCLQSEDAKAQTEDGKPGVKCSKCEYVTDATLPVENCYLTVHAERLRIIKSGGACDSCAEETRDAQATAEGVGAARGQEAEEAEEWCRECRKLLCHSCLEWHNRFNSKHERLPAAEVMAAARADDETAAATLAPILRCPDHRGEQLTRMCMTCDKPRCRQCETTVCRDHRVLDGEDEEVREYAEKERQELLRLKDELLNEMEQLDKNEKELEEQIDKTRADCVKKLQDNKQKAMDEIEKAYNIADEEWQAKCDEMLHDAEKLQEEVDKLEKHAKHASQYVGILLDSEDRVSLLQQEQRVLACLEKLTKRAEELDKQLDEVEKYEIVGEVPPNIDQIMREWIGVPKWEGEKAAANAGAVAAGAEASSASSESSSGDPVARSGASGGAPSFAERAMPFGGARAAAAFMGAEGGRGGEAEGASGPGGAAGDAMRGVTDDLQNLILD